MACYRVFSTESELQLGVRSSGGRRAACGRFALLFFYRRVAALNEK